MKGGRLWIVVGILTLFVMFFGCTTGGGGGGGDDDDDDITPDDDTIEVPEAPSDLTATYTEFGVELNWTDNSDNENGFYIYRKLEGEEEFSQIGEVGENIDTFVDDTFECDSSATYYVTAYNDDGESDASNEAETGLIICAPSDLDVNAFYGDTLDIITIRLTWADNSEIEDGYRLERKLPDKSDWEELADLEADSTEYEYTIDCEDYERSVEYRVVAYKDDTDSMPSETTLTKGMGCFETYNIVTGPLATLVGGDVAPDGTIHILFGEPVGYWAGDPSTWHSMQLYGLWVLSSNVFPSVDVDSDGYAHMAIGMPNFNELIYIKMPPPDKAAETAETENETDDGKSDYYISCGDTKHGVLSSQSNSLQTYSCWASPLPGPDVSYRIILNEPTLLNVNLEWSSNPAVLLLLSDETDGSSCIAANMNGVTAYVPTGTYYLMVDTPYTSIYITYTLTVECITDAYMKVFEDMIPFGTGIDTNSNNAPVIAATGYSASEGDFALEVISKSSPEALWEREVVELVGYGGGYMAPSVSVKVDSQDKPHVFYQSGGYYYSVKYARKADKGWNIEDVESNIYGGYLMLGLSDGTLDANDNPHVSYLKMADYTAAVMHAFKESGDWTLETIEHITGYFILDNSSAIETFGDEPEVHIVYATLYAGLRYATNASGSWETYQLVAPPMLKFEPDTPLWPEIFIDEDGYIYILYVHGWYGIWGTDVYLITNKPE